MNRLLVDKQPPRREVAHIRVEEALRALDLYVARRGREEVGAAFEECESVAIPVRVRGHPGTPTSLERTMGSGLAAADVCDLGDCDL